MDFSTEMAQRRVGVLVGAGVSVVPPSCLPSWWSLNHAILRALAEAGREVLPSAEALAEAIIAKQEAGSLPPEFTAELITARFGAGYFEVLRCLEGSEPNRVHLTLAALAKAQRLPVIVTTNFDTLIERACEQLGVELRVLVEPADYAGLDVAAHLADASSPPWLIKLHGSASKPQTCIDTLAQRKQGLAPEVQGLMREVVAQTTLTMLGYSGADLEAEPNYLALREHAEVAEAPGFVWLQLPGREPLPAVRELAEAYGPARGRIVEGALPEWLAVFEPVLGEALPEAAPMSAEQVAAEREAAEQRLREQAQQWARTISDAYDSGSSRAWCAVTLIDLAAHVGLVEAAREADEALAAWTSEHEPQEETHGAVLLRLARDRQDQGAIDEAIAAYKQAYELFGGKGHLDGVGAVIIGYATLLERVGDFAQAEPLYRQAIALYREHDEPEGVVTASTDLANALATRGRGDEAEALLRDAIELARSQGDEARRTLALQNLAIVLRAQGKLAEAIAVLDEADEVNRRLGFDERWALGRVVRAEIYAMAGELDEAFVLIKQVDEIATRLGNKQVEAAGTHLHAKIFSVLGRNDEAAALADRSVACRQALRDVEGMLNTISTQVSILFGQGRYQEAITLGEPRIAEARKLCLSDTVITLATNVGLAYEYGGNVERALALYHEANEVAAQAGDVHGLAQLAGNIGNIEIRRGNTDAAEAAYHQSLQACKALGDIQGRIRNLANLANIVMARQGDMNEATSRNAEALELAKEHGFEGMTGIIELNQGFAYWQQEALEQAGPHFARALKLLQAAGDKVQAAQAAAYLAFNHAHRQNYAEAHEAANQALTLWREAGSEHELLPQVAELLEQLRSVGHGDAPA